mmetsp:Transcript_27622/g.70374  ORF Transcript_27622/g.70374 Transcript_27622/m.70374 type:complete len:203 (+) Transcript_27622:561-1169(+)
MRRRGTPARQQTTPRQPCKRQQAGHRLSYTRCHWCCWPCCCQRGARCRQHYLFCQPAINAAMAPRPLHCPPPHHSARCWWHACARSCCTRKGMWLQPWRCWPKSRSKCQRRQGRESRRQRCGRNWPKRLLLRARWLMPSFARTSRSSCCRGRRAPTTCWGACWRQRAGWRRRPTRTTQHLRWTRAMRHHCCGSGRFTGGQVV